MKMVTTGIVAAATLLSAAPTLAIGVDIGPSGITVGARYRDYDERSYFGDRAYDRNRDYRNSADCRKVTIDRPDGSRVVRYRCD